MVNIKVNYATMKDLLFGCRYSNIWASPADWNTTTSKKSLKKKWFVEYIFYDPLFIDRYPEGKPVRKALNRDLKTLEERKAAVKFCLEQIPIALEQQHYNPITQRFMVPPPVMPAPDAGKLTPDMPCTEAIDLAWDKILTAAKANLKDDDAKPFEDVKAAKKRFVRGLKELRYDIIPIKDLKLVQVKETIVHLKITDGYYNKFLSYLSKIFTELIEYECIEYNHFKMLKKKKPPVTGEREVLTDDEFDGVMDYLHDKHYCYFRYGMIFHLSGARSTELMNVKRKDVNLAKQEYKVLIKKGDRYTEEIKVIIPDAIPFWIEVLKECSNDNDYLFSHRFRPGPIAMAARQVSRKWQTLVKIQYNDENKTDITADFYGLKHKFLDKLDAMRNESGMVVNIAQAMASHTTDKMTNTVYLVNKKKREREVLKTLVISKAAS